MLITTFIECLKEVSQDIVNEAGFLGRRCYASIQCLTKALKCKSDDGVIANFCAAVAQLISTNDLETSDRGRLIIFAMEEVCKDSGRDYQELYNKITAHWEGYDIAKRNKLEASPFRVLNPQIISLLRAPDRLSGVLTSLSQGLVFQAQKMFGQSPVVAEAAAERPPSASEVGSPADVPVPLTDGELGNRLCALEKQKPGELISLNLPTTLTAVQITYIIDWISNNHSFTRIEFINCRFKDNAISAILEAVRGYCMAYPEKKMQICFATNAPRIGELSVGVLVRMLRECKSLGQLEFDENHSLEKSPDLLDQLSSAIIERAQRDQLTDRLLPLSEVHMPVGGSQSLERVLEASQSQAKAFYDSYTLNLEGDGFLQGQERKFTYEGSGNQADDAGAPPPCVSEATMLTVPSTDHHTVEGYSRAPVASVYPNDLGLAASSTLRGFDFSLTRATTTAGLHASFFPPSCVARMITNEELEQVLNGALAKGELSFTGGPIKFNESQIGRLSGWIRLNCCTNIQMDNCLLSASDLVYITQAILTRCLSLPQVPLRLNIGNTEAVGSSEDSMQALEHMIRSCNNLCCLELGKDKNFPPIQLERLSKAFLSRMCNELYPLELLFSGTCNQFMEVMHSQASGTTAIGIFEKNYKEYFQHNSYILLSRKLHDFEVDAFDATGSLSGTAVTRAFVNYPLYTHTQAKDCHVKFDATKVTWILNSQNIPDEEILKPSFAAASRP